MDTIFETERLDVRKLKLSDFEPFHEMQHNINVMQYVRGSAMTYQENKDELTKLIEFYEKPDNDFGFMLLNEKRMVIL